MLVYRRVPVLESSLEPSRCQPPHLAGITGPNERMDSLGGQRASASSTTPESGPVGFQFLSQKDPRADRL